MATQLGGVPLYQPRQVAQTNPLDSLIQGFQQGNAIAQLPQQQAQMAAAQDLNQLITNAKIQELQQGKLMEVNGSLVRINPQTGQAEVVFRGEPKAATPVNFQSVGFTQDGKPISFNPRTNEYELGTLPQGVTAQGGFLPKTTPAETQTLVGTQGGNLLQFGNRGSGVTTANTGTGVNPNAPILPTTQKPLRKGMLLADKNGVVSFTVLDEGEKLPEGARIFTPPSANDETSLRKEFMDQPFVKDFVEIAPQYQRIQAAMEEAKTSKTFTAVDQTLINTFNKILDPKSVVRESEYARTADDQSVLDYLKGKIDPKTGKIFVGGAGLTPENRAAMERMAKRFYDAAQNNYLQTAGYYSGIAKDRGFQFGLPPAPIGEIVPIQGATSSPASTAPRIIRITPRSR